MWQITSQDKPNVLVIGYRKFSQLINTVVPEFEEVASIKITDYVFEKDMPIGDLVVRNRADVVVSAGSNAAYLKSTLSVPVASLEVSEGDVVEALLKAASIGKRILLITYEKECRVLDMLTPLLDAEVTHRVYSTPNEAREILDLSAPEGFDVVIGSSYICELAERQGITSILIYSKVSCRKVLATALEKGRETIEHELQGVINSAVFESAAIPIVVTDLSGNLLRYNQVAVRELALEGSEDSARIAKLLDLENQESDSVQRYTIELSGHAWYVQKSPFSVKERRRGYIHRFFNDPLWISNGKTKIDKRGSEPRRLVYAAESMARVDELACYYGGTQGTILIEGETGTGKELVAQEIYRNSTHGKGEFVAVNCGAIPDELFESELFGYVDGAFTNSRRGGRTGLLQTAHNGVFFLDEISELPLSQQAKLLRVLQDRRLRPLGSNREVTIDTKFICATNRNLRDCVDQGRFREDLFYRINIFKIEIPALRERQADIMEIGRHFAERFNLQYDLGLDVGSLMTALSEPMGRYHWPGNVRELENVIERAVVSRAAFTDHDAFMASLPTLVPEWFVSDTTPIIHDAQQELREEGAGALKEQERSLILDAIERFNGDKSKIAGYLGISQTTLWRRLKKLKGVY